MRRTRSELQSGARLRSGDLELLAFERQGLSTAQIARALDTTITAMDSRFQHARRRWAHGRLRTGRCPEPICWSSGESVSNRQARASFAPLPRFWRRHQQVAIDALKSGDEIAAKVIALGRLPVH